MVDEKVFDKAVEIAHQFLWLADCPRIGRKARKEINKLSSHYSLDPQMLLGSYVAIICREVMREEAKC